MSYRHIVLFRVYEAVAEADLQAEVVEDVTFADGAAYETFRGSPEHEGITAEWAGMADWLVGDYVIESGRDADA